MWNLLRCYLTGRHDYGVGCEPGAIFLRCVHCGHRSSGWSMDSRATVVSAPAVAVPMPVPVSGGAALTGAVAPLHAVPATRMSARVIPFQRTLTN